MAFAADQVVGVVDQTNATVKRVDVSEITRADSSLAERQRMAIPGIVAVDSEFLRLVLIELRLQSILLAQQCGINDDLTQMRSDISTTEDLSY